MDGERRRKLRTESLNFVSYSYYSLDMDGIIKEMGRTLDISVGGIKLEVPSDRVPDKEVELLIALKETVINVKGEIVHKEVVKEVTNIGIRFEEIPEEDKETLKRFLEEEEQGV